MNIVGYALCIVGVAALMLTLAKKLAPRDDSGPSWVIARTFATMFRRKGYRNDGAEPPNVIFRNR